MPLSFLGEVPEDGGDDWFSYIRMELLLDMYIYVEKRIALGGYALAIMATSTATTMIAICAPVDRFTEPFDEPLDPSSPSGPT